MLYIAGSYGVLLGPPPGQGGTPRPDVAAPTMPAPLSSHALLPNPAQMAITLPQAGKILCNRS